ncbi:threonine transporter [Amycolatopsis sp. QT-25]|uniref:ABC-three component system middle component 2 n=1 Tax=Amycolatopsis sp. QT-25 TaxID=3034022 RepID=UPI0023ED009B|nr:ABC-three component system middle component 2 [Amycolatopsis sp. QT-25]WET81632.1 threonine transporter [Amycolatopsis sp. QT-25]
MRSPLNGPLEYGLRVLVMLTEAYPQQLDINHLVLLDHTVLHTAEIGGPPSIHPDHPLHAGELGVRRANVEEGLRVMLRSGLIDMQAPSTGIRYQAGEEAYSFVSGLASSYIAELRSRSRWVVERFATMSDEQIRQQTTVIFRRRPADAGTTSSERQEDPWNG